MKMGMTIMIMLTFLMAVAGMAMAGTWDTRCMVCHKDGNSVKAPTRDELRTKHKTPEALVKAALENKNGMMKSVQKEDLLKEAAKELFP